MTLRDALRSWRIEFALGPNGQPVLLAERPVPQRRVTEQVHQPISGGAVGHALESLLAYLGDLESAS